MRNLHFHRDNHRLWVGKLGAAAKPVLAQLNGDRMRIIATFVDDQSAVDTQEILAQFLTGQSASSALRKG